MSTIAEMLIIEQKEHLKVQYPEMFESKEVECRRCGGKGFHMPYQTGWNSYDQDECDTCHGTGKLKAEITVKWKPVGGKRKKIDEV